MKKWISLKDQQPLMGEKAIVLLEDGIAEAVFLGSDVIGFWALPEGGMVQTRLGKWMYFDKPGEADK